MPKDETRELALPPEDRVETGHGTICLAYLDRDKVRVASGRNVGWMRLDGAPLYATALFQRGDEGWVIEPARSAVTSVVDDKAGDRVPDDVRDAAWKVLEETFASWLEARPDIAAQLVVVERKAEEYQAEDRIEDLLAEVARLRKRLPALRAARAEAEAEVEQVMASMGSSPKP